MQNTVEDAYTDIRREIELAVNRLLDARRSYQPSSPSGSASSLEGAPTPGGPFQGSKATPRMTGTEPFPEDEDRDIHHRPYLRRYGSAIRGLRDMIRQQSHYSRTDLHNQLTSRISAFLENRISEENFQEFLDWFYDKLTEPGNGENA